MEPIMKSSKHSKRRSYSSKSHGQRLSLESLERRELLDAGWVAAISGAGSDRLWDLAGDAAGNTYVVGEFSGTAALGSKNLTSAGGSDVFVAKLNSAGQV